MWRRHDIFKIFAEAILSLSPKINVVCVGSEGKLSRQLAKSYNFYYIEFSNASLINKLNAGCYMLKKLNTDLAIMLGSDDLINQSLLDAYIDAYKKGYDYVYLTDGYFYDLASKKTLYWAGYNEKHNIGDPLGAGRALSKKALIKMNWKVWERGYDRIADTGFDKRLKYIKPLKSMALRCQNSDYFILDIKSETNMTPFKKWPNSYFVGNSVIKNKFPKDIWSKFL